MTVRNKLRLIYILVFSLLFLYIFKSSEKNRAERENFSKNGNLTIGVIKFKSIGNKSVSYKYNVENKEFRGGDPRYYMDPNGSDVFDDEEKSKPGKRFLVIYDINNPKKSIIRLDYPIKDSADFKQYVKEFEQMRKQIE